MIKLLLLISLCISTIMADSINLTAGVGSKHFLPYQLNEDNGGIGIGYEYTYNDNTSIDLDYLKFTNSYNRETNFIGLTVNYTPLNYNDYKLGIFGGIVHIVSVIISS